MTARRLAILLSIALIAMFSLMLPVLATEGEETPEPISEETPEPVSGGQTPAVEVTTPPVDETQLDWTYRYMIPTALALGAIVIVVTAAQYFTSVVRKRYRIVEE